MEFGIARAVPVVFPGRRIFGHGCLEPMDCERPFRRHQEPNPRGLTEDCESCSRGREGGNGGRGTAAAEGCPAGPGNDGPWLEWRPIIRNIWWSFLIWESPASLNGGIMSESSGTPPLSSLPSVCLPDIFVYDSRLCCISTRLRSFQSFLFVCLLVRLFACNCC